MDDCKRCQKYIETFDEIDVALFRHIRTMETVVYNKAIHMRDKTKREYRRKMVIMHIREAKKIWKKINLIRNNHKTLW